MKFEDMKKESKAVLSIFAKQILDIVNSDEVDSYKITEIREHVALWVRSNNLHPEEVKTLTEEKENMKSLKKVYVVGINNNTLTPDIIDDIWCEEDGTL
jgi:hypothetical protein